LHIFKLLRVLNDGCNKKGGNMGTRLYVGNISFKATEADLRNLFSKTGEVVSVKLIKDSATGKMRGFGFVEMATKEDANNAIAKLNGNSFMNRNIIVNEAKPRERRERERTRRRDTGTREGNR
jgi:RNA recognition motif-containing protein